ncbi:hypothetical protein [Bythopirellula polymerisocia]|uniref:Uncharacterized protein n=1 Tax=Bythopirellula polymerisocia TaxID=2528003 RepID=A0A5C6CII5_9BACT|nr:hypothetical protein [Bythopirellula polymerisocia]TWU24603.1 hypothetical protein Pla144_34880 [Bythopirellula polymerisocia]
MLSLGIDQHARQLTVSLRNEEGDVLQGNKGEESRFRTRLPTGSVEEDSFLKG